MLTRIIASAFICTVFILNSCAKSVPEMEGSGEKLIWQSEKPRPSWPENPPETNGPNLFVVGVSKVWKRETLANDDSRLDAQVKVAEYAETLVKSKVDDIAAAVGLSSDILNPSITVTASKSKISTQLVNHIKPVKYYKKKLEENGSVGWKTYVLVRVPKRQFESAFKTGMDVRISNAKELKERKRINDEIAIEQLDRAIEMMEKAKKAKILN